MPRLSPIALIRPLFAAGLLYESFSSPRFAQGGKDYRR